jgi:hypothetical protein
MLAERTFCSDFLFSGTSTFSCPSPKNCPSLPALTPLALAKKESLTDSGTDTEAMSTLVEVAITYAWLTRRRGTPLSLFCQFPIPCIPSRVDILERTGNEQKTRVELLEEDDPLSAVLSAEQDQDGSGGDGFPQNSLAVGLSGSFWSGNILGWVVLGCL